MAISSEARPSLISFFQYRKSEPMVFEALESFLEKRREMIDQRSVDIRFLFDDGSVSIEVYGGERILGTVFWSLYGLAPWTKLRMEQGESFAQQVLGVSLSVEESKRIGGRLEGEIVIQKKDEILKIFIGKTLFDDGALIRYSRGKDIDFSMESIAVLGALMLLPGDYYPLIRERGLLVAGVNEEDVSSPAAQCLALPANSWRKISPALKNLPEETLVVLPTCWQWGKEEVEYLRRKESLERIEDFWLKASRSTRPVGFLLEKGREAKTGLLEEALKKGDFFPVTPSTESDFRD